MIALVSAGPADVWRYASAAVALLVFLAITVALRATGHRLERAWRFVLRAITFQQAVLAYLAVARAHDTPRGFPEQADGSLIALVLSGVVLFVAAVSVIAGTRADGPRSRHVSA